MRHHTILIEFPEGDGPGYHKGMKVFGGDVVAVCFSDALAELQDYQESRDELLSAIERLRHNFNLLLAQKPCRDVDECLAEVDHAIANAKQTNLKAREAYL